MSSSGRLNAGWSPDGKLAYMVALAEWGCCGSSFAKHRPGLRGVVLQVGGPRPQRAVEARDTPVLRGWSLDRRGTNRPVRTAAYRSPLLRRTHVGRLREPFLPLRPEPPKCRQYTAPGSGQ